MTGQRPQGFAGEHIADVFERASVVTGECQRRGKQLFEFVDDAELYRGRRRPQILQILRARKQNQLTLGVDVGRQEREVQLVRTLRVGDAVELDHVLELAIGQASKSERAKAD